MHTLFAVILLVASVHAGVDSQPATRGAKVQVIEQLFRQGQLVEGMKQLTELAAASPDEPDLWKAICHVPPGTYHRLDPNEKKKANELGEKLLVTLMDACKANPSPGRSVNLVESAQEIGSLGMAKELLSDRSKFLGELLCGSYIFEDCGPDLFAALASFQFHFLHNYDAALRMLDRAETVALKLQPEDRNEAVLHIAWLRATSIFFEEGPSDALVGTCYRILELDRANGHQSNRALDYLGQIAFGKGNVDQARAYLALAGRVKVDNMLWAWGYEKGLALALIRAGYPDPAIEYLEIAYNNEKRVNEKTVLGLGLGYLAKGEKGKAKEFLGKYLEQDYKPEKDLVKSLLSSLDKPQE